MNEVESPLVTEPVQAAERIHALDLVRGFALIGVLLGNINILLPQPLVATSQVFADNPTFVDTAVKWFIGIFVDDNFYTLFSLLFGAGFVIFLDRAQRRGASAKWLFLRRLGGLFLIGVAHRYLIWYGDILATYAMTGVALLVFANTSASRLWKWGVALYLLLPVVGWLQWLLTLDAGIPDAAAIAAAQEAAQAKAEAAALIYTTGSWWEVAQQRFSDLLYIWRVEPYFMPTILGMFLIGAAIARSGLLTSLEDHRPLLRRMAWIGFLVGTPLATYAQAAYEFGLGMGSISAHVGAVLMCLAYAATLALLAQRVQTLLWLKPLVPVGRMALTNYLLQSLVFTWVFCGYGLGLGDSLGRTVTNLMALVFFAAQIWFSGWWLARYRFGPMEWVWRTMTYGRIQPLRKDASADARA